MLCPQCGTKNEDVARFCMACGTRLPGDPESEVSGVRPAPRKGRVVQRRRSGGWLISGTGALVALVCFFLPWFTASCAGMPLLEVSGQELAAGVSFYGEEAFGYPYLWLTLLAPVICLFIAGIAYAKDNISRSWAVGQVLLPGVGLIAMLITFLQVALQSRSHKMISEGLIRASPEVGLWGTFLGYLIIVVGAVLGFHRGSRTGEPRKARARPSDTKDEQESALVCPECSAKNTAGAAQCESCGAPLRRGLFAKWLGISPALFSLLAVVIAALVLVVFVVGRDGGEKAGIVGTYYNQANPEEYLELKADGTFYLKEMGIGFAGEWTVEGDVITLSFSAGFAARGRIKGNTIADEDGKTWVKGSAKVSAPVSLTPSLRQSFATPKDTIAQLVRALNAYDADAVYETFSSRLKRERSREQLAKSFEEEKNVVAARIESYKILAAEIVGDQADVIARMTTSFNETGRRKTETKEEHFSLIREDGMWKVASTEEVVSERQRTAEVPVTATSTAQASGGSPMGSPLVGIPHMSNEPNGREIRHFSSGTDTVYLVFDYETAGPVEISVEVRSEAQGSAVIFTSRETYEGTGTANIEIEGPGSSSFPRGIYDTIIWFGPMRYVTAGWEWVVGD